MSKQFKKGDKIKALRSALDITEGNVYEVVNAGGHWPVVRDDVGEENGMLGNDDFELAEPELPFKSGDWVTPRESEFDRYFTKGTAYLLDRCEISEGGNVVVRLRDDEGDPRMRLAEDWAASTPPHAAEVRQPAPYYTISSTLEQYRTPHASIQAAKDWVTEYGTPGTVYTIHEARDVGTFNVVRELKEAV